MTPRLPALLVIAIALHFSLGASAIRAQEASRDATIERLARPLAGGSRAGTGGEVVLEALDLLAKDAGALERIPSFARGGELPRIDRAELSEDALASLGSFERWVAAGAPLPAAPDAFRDRLLELKRLAALSLATADDGGAPAAADRVATAGIALRDGGRSFLEIAGGILLVELAIDGTAARELDTAALRARARPAPELVLRTLAVEGLVCIRQADRIAAIAREKGRAGIAAEIGVAESELPAIDFEAEAATVRAHVREVLTLAQDRGRSEVEIDAALEEATKRAMADPERHPLRRVLILRPERVRSTLRKHAARVEGP